MASVAAALALLIATGAAAQQPELHTGTELHSLLKDRAGIDITMPGLGYLWTDSDISGVASTGIDETRCGIPTSACSAAMRSARAISSAD